MWKEGDLCGCCLLVFQKRLICWDFPTQHLYTLQRRSETEKQAAALWVKMLISEENGQTASS